MAATVVLLNVVGWALLAKAVGHHFHISQTKLFGLGTGVLAYTLGVRHAFDVDHIAAIDNTTRKLVGEENARWAWASTSRSAIRASCWCSPSC